MPLFIYKATDVTGKLVEGTIEGKNEPAVVLKLRNSKLLPMSVKPENGKKRDLTGGLSLFGFFNKLSSQDVLNFTRQLATLMKAGLNLDRSLTIMIELSEKELMNKVVEDLQKNVHSGNSFADALSKYPESFSKLYVNMVRAGEEGGILDVILERLAGFIESTERLLENVKSALIYPTLLTFVGGGAVVVLLTFVVPKFSEIFADLGQAIPFSTQILLDISFFLTEYWWLLIFLLIALTLLFKIFSMTEKGRFFLDTAALKLPMVGEILSKVQVSRFARTLGTLLNSGVPLLKALGITGDILTNVVITKSMKKINARVKEGSGISDTLKESGVFPPMAIHMIRVGEETGQLEDMLLKVSETYEKDVDNSVKKFIALFEPVMILVMGLIVGFIVISMLLAIFSITDIPL